MQDSPKDMAADIRHQCHQRINNGRLCRKNAECQTCDARGLQFEKRRVAKSQQDRRHLELSNAKAKKQCRWTRVSRAFSPASTARPPVGIYGAPVWLVGEELKKRLRLASSARTPERPLPCDPTCWICAGWLAAQLTVWIASQFVALVVLTQLMLLRVGPLKTRSCSKV
jgi:hypothetical protein